jgi:hypothetical protein
MRTVRLLSLVVDGGAARVAPGRRPETITRSILQRDVRPDWSPGAWDAMRSPKGAVTSLPQ